MWKWLKRVLLGVLAWTVIYTAWVVCERDWIKRRGNRELAAAVAETDSQDPNWRWADLNAARRQLPGDQNAALLIPRIKSLTAPGWGKEFNAENLKEAHRVEPNVRYPTHLLTLVRDDLTRSTEAVKLARTLKNFPSGHREITLAPNVYGTLLEDTQHTRHAADLLRWRIAVGVEGGTYEGIGDDLLALLNASRSIGDEPFLISQLVRMATRTVMVATCERVIAQTPGRAELLALRLEAVQAALHDDLTEPLLLHGVRGERATFQVLCDNLENGTADLNNLVDGPGKASTDPLFRPSWWLYRGRIPADRAFALRWFNLAEEAARKPIEEQSTAINMLPIPPEDKNHILSRTLLPAVNKVAASHWRTTAEGQCAVAGIACERFRLVHDRWPDTLAELVPEFLQAVPLDPRDGQPLQYRKLDDGVLVHSTGPFVIGEVPRAARPGLPDRIEAGFRLWNPAARRQPPPPEPVDPDRP